MSNQNQHKPGYKHTPLGWIPEEWQICELGKHVITFSGGTPSRTVSSYYGGDIPWIKSGDLNKGRIMSVDEYLTDEGLNNSSAKIVEPGTLLLALYGATAGVTAFTEIKAAINQAVLAIQPTNGSYDKSYLDNWFKNHKQQIIYTYCQGGQPNLSADLVKSLLVKTPTVSEQRKIASILSTWDEAINKTHQIIAQLQQRNKGLMQQLLTGKKRLKGFEAEWKKVRLGDYLIKHEEKTSVSNQYPVLTSSREGLFLQRDYYKREVASIDNTGYNVVPRGFFTYRHMSDDLVFKFNINDIVDKGIVSTLYPVFTTTAGLDKHFLKYKLNEGREFAHFALEQKQGGSRTYVYFSKLSELKIMLPSLDEQTAIRVAIETAHSEQFLFEQKLAALQQQKKGLMQKLLTGEVRVKIDN